MLIFRAKKLNKELNNLIILTKKTVIILFLVCLVIAFILAIHIKDLQIVVEVLRIFSNVLSTILINI